MTVLVRNEVSVLRSNLLETVADYRQDVTYSKGDRVLFDRYIYEYVDELSSSNKPPNSPEGALSWKSQSPSNKYALFDFYEYTQSVGERGKPIEIEFSLRSSSKSGLYLGNLDAKRVVVEVADLKQEAGLDGDLREAVYERKEYTLYATSILDWLDYFYGDWGSDSIKEIYFKRETLFLNVKYRLYISNGDDAARIGMCLAGDEKKIGLTVYNNKIGTMDFSKILTDEEGRTSIKKGNSKKTNSTQVLIRNNTLDYVVNILRSIRSTPAVFILSTNYRSLMNFGILKNWDLLLDKKDYSLIDMEIEGLV